ncbi:hypothetical protein [Mannheimia varigena]|uniref:hypothetical protein n=1 Tax=Mannheimia varigena TaxID=85404 RepID=UPI0015B4A57A|nr:hypothetical protein [Mannheimia varigena]QLD32921.1 hypothetical protein A6B42_03655 [Mannheimia varigena]
MEKIKMGNFCYFVMLSIITFFTILIFNKIGWANAGILLVVFFTFFAASIVRKNQEIKRDLEEKELNEWLEKSSNAQLFKISYATCHQMILMMKSTLLPPVK